MLSEMMYNETMKKIESPHQVVGRYDVEDVVDEDVDDDLEVIDVVEDDLDDKVRKKGLNDVEWMLGTDDVDEVVLLDYHRSGMSLQTPMATHTGVGLVNQTKVVEIDVVQDVEDEMDVIKIRKMKMM